MKSLIKEGFSPEIFVGESIRINMYRKEIKQYCTKVDSRGIHEYAFG